VTCPPRCRISPVARAPSAVTDPFKSIAQAAKECGFPPSTIRNFLRRLKARYQPLHDTVQEVKVNELIALLDDRAMRAVAHMDDFAMATAGVKDLAIAAGVMIDKSQLLKGQPTSIISTAEREQLRDLLPKLLREAERRGITIEGEIIRP